MKTLEDKLERGQRLVKEYISIAGELDFKCFWFEGHDACMYDAEGYADVMYEALEDEDEEYMNEILNNLTSQVKAMRLLLQGFEQLKFIYG